MTLLDTQLRCVDAARQRGSGAGSPLAAALLGFFVITLDALVVNVALPLIGHDFGGGITGLQWVVDGYTLMFAALLLPPTAASSLLLRPTPRQRQQQIDAHRGLSTSLALNDLQSAGNWR